MKKEQRSKPLLSIKRLEVVAVVLAAVHEVKDELLGWVNQRFMDIRKELAQYLLSLLCS